MIRIVVDGPPIGKGRPRFFVQRRPGRSDIIGAKTPDRTVHYEAILALRGAEAMNGQPPITGPVDVRVVAYMPVAASWSKKKTATALAGGLRPGKPDADNLLKCLDSLNGIVWRDDAQIAEARISKRYDPDPRLVIEVTEL